MAEYLGSPPNLDDICRSLARYPQGRLCELLRRLQQRASTNSRKLLEAIILKSLGRPKSAMEVLKSIPDTKAARYVALQVQNERLQCRGDRVQPSQQDPDLLQTVEQMYALLQEEKICCDPDQPHTLRSGPGFPSSSSPTRVTSPCIPIEAAKSNSVESLNSRLAISQSPTALFMTGAGQGAHQQRMPSKLLNDPTSSCVQEGGGGDVPGDAEDNRGMLLTPAVEGTEKTGFASTGSGPLVCKAPSIEGYPVECTDMTGIKQQVSEMESVSAHNPKETPVLSPVHETKPVTSCPSTAPVEAASSIKEVENSPSTLSTPSLSIEGTDPKEQTEVQQLPSSFASLPSKEPEGTEDGFFSFVILHVPEDEEIASSIQGNLERLGVKNGTTFCEGFQRPGSHRLNCLEEAINNSAFTVLLLTKDWTSHWANFQANTVLMNAIECKQKYNTVIPFLPRNNKLQKNKMDLSLKALIPLEEISPTFSVSVKKTFTPDRIAEQKSIWRKEKEIRAIKEKTESAKLEVDQMQQMQDAKKDLLTEQQKYLLCQPMTFMGPNVLGGVPGHFPPFSCESPFQPMQWMPGTVPPADVGFPIYPFYPFQYGSSQIVPPMVSNGTQGAQYASGGQHPVIQIQHASNVQIGDLNQMTIERADGEGEKTKEEEEDESVTLS